MKAKGTLRQRIAAINEQRDKYIITPALEDWFVANPNWAVPEHIIAIIARELRAKARDRTQSFSASSAGRCHREQVFRFIGVPELPFVDSRLGNIFSDGTWRHLRYQSILLDAGVLDAIEVPITSTDGLFKGTMDGTGGDPGIGPYIVELKGINPFGFKVLTESGRPKEEHLLQGANYSFFYGVPLVTFFYEDKATQTTKEFVVDYDDPAWRPYADMAGTERGELAGYVSAGVLPPPLIDAPKNQHCRGCAFRTVCPELRDWEEAEAIKALGVDVLTATMTEEDSDSDDEAPSTRRVKRPKRRKSDG